jgi:hypothetical protein
MTAIHDVKNNAACGVFGRRHGTTDGSGGERRDPAAERRIASLGAGPQVVKIAQ